jgi:two-component system response regulator QseB
MNILLVEDDLMIACAIRDGLKTHGFNVDVVSNGVSAESALAIRPPDLVLLDLGLPRKSGMDVLRDLRLTGNQVPVLILTARDGVSDRIRGLDCGADDYLAKPFDMGELAARVRALVRRRQPAGGPIPVSTELELDHVTREATYRGKRLRLSVSEFALLRVLAERPGHPLSVRQIEERLYASAQNVDSNTVEVRVHHLRRKLGPDIIANVRGVGYMVPK